MRNYAFISYSHADMKCVRKLHKKIEGFRIPYYVRKYLKHSPRKIYPIFRDETDLPAGELRPNIQKALRESDFLIVICSERSVQSEWVELEIEEFIRNHDVEVIIPVLLSEEARDVFQNDIPDGLIKIGKSRSEALFYGGRYDKKCVFEVVTQILHCFSRELTERYLRRQKAFMTIKVCFLAFLMLLLSLEFNWWYKNRYDIVKYYRDIKFCYDWPEGVEELKYRQLSEVEDYYICTYRNNRIIRTEHIYSEAKPHGIPLSLCTEADCMEYEYNNYWGENGYAEARISQITYKTSDGDTIFVKNYSLTQEIVDLTISEQDCTPYYLPSDFTQDRRQHDMASNRIAQWYDADGRLAVVWFLSDTTSAMVCDINGYYGMEYEYGENGSISAVHYLNQEGKIMAEERVDF